MVRVCSGRPSAANGPRGHFGACSVTRRNSSSLLRLRSARLQMRRLDPGPRGWALGRRGAGGAAAKSGADGGGARHVGPNSSGQSKVGWHRPRPLSANGRARHTSCRGQPIRVAAGGKPAPRARPISGGAAATSAWVRAQQPPLGRRSPHPPRGGRFSPCRLGRASVGRARLAPRRSARSRVGAARCSRPAPLTAAGAPGAAAPGGARRAIVGALR